MAYPSVEVYDRGVVYREDFLDMNDARKFAMYYLGKNKDILDVSVYRGNKIVEYVVKTVKGYAWCTRWEYDWNKNQFIPIKGVPIKEDGRIREQRTYRYTYTSNRR